METEKITMTKVYESDLKVIRSRSKQKTGVEQIKECVLKCEDLRGKKDNTKVPAFLLKNSVSNEEVFAYLTKNSKSAKFIYQEYAENRPLIEKLCNPLYLPAVA